MTFRRALVGSWIGAVVLACAPTTEPKAAGDPAHGCSTSVSSRSGETRVEQLTSGGPSRQYLVHVPAGYQPSRPIPVVLAFHGRGERPEFLEQDSGLDALDDLVVYPLGTEGTGGTIGWEGAPYSSDADDVQFVRDLLDRLEYLYCVNAGRVYATGMSNGGGFVGMLACRLADRITAIAPVSAAFYDSSQEPCDPMRPVPVLNFHGTADPVVPFDGAPGRGLPAMADWVSRWVERDRCSHRPGQFFQSDDVTAQRWDGCAGGVVVENYVIDGAGHTWPGGAGKQVPALGEVTRTISAARVMDAFFKLYRL